VSQPSWNQIVESLEARSLEFDDGLSDQEVADVEERYRFSFPPDLRTLLQTALPSSDRFPNWRSDPAADLERRMAWPAEGIAFDVENNQFWLSAWGPRPSGLTDALALARAKVAEAPSLIPVYSHRFLPDEPHEAGNPVFSVYQTDIVHYGADLVSYLNAEFGIETEAAAPSSPRPIRFWSDLVS
jgi:hypothetical protein